MCSCCVFDSKEKKRRQRKKRNELEIHILFILNSEHDNKYFMIFLALCRGIGYSLSGFRVPLSRRFLRMCTQINFCCFLFRSALVCGDMIQSEICISFMSFFSFTTFSLCRVLSGSELDLCSNKIQILLYFYRRLVEWHPLTRNRINTYL